MRHVACLLCAALAFSPALAGEEQDRYEEQSTTRCANQKADRGLRADRGERGQWVRELEAAYPGKLEVKDGGDEAATWFALVAGTADEWRKADASAAGLGQMFERMAQRMELGPVPSIKRDEFIRFVKQFTRNNAPAAPADNLDGSADKVFRVLDANADGELTGEELSTALREARGQADANGNGRISKEEYRDYFEHKVEKKAEALTAAYKANDALWRGLEGKGARGGMPEWFSSLDADKDKQVSLFEWRAGGKPLALFNEMDLDDDGLLTRDEYFRYAKMKFAAEEQKKQEEK